MNDCSKVHVRYGRRLAHILLAILLAVLALFLFTALLGSSTVASGPADLSPPGTKIEGVVNHVVSLPKNRGADDYLLIDSGSISPSITSTLRLTQSFSVAFWFKYTKKALLTNQPVDHDTGQFLAVRNGLKLKFNAFGGANRNINLALGFPNWEVTTWGNANGRRRTVLPNEWVHIAFVYDAPQRQLRVYFNGRFAVMQTAEAGAAPFFDVGALEIGNPCCLANDLEGTLAFAMDDLVIYRGALQDTEVAQLYAEPDPLLGGSEAQAVAYWPFEEQQSGQFVFVDEISGLRLTSHVGQNDTHIKSEIAVIPRFAYEPSPHVMYVVDTGNHRIQYFSRSGDFLGEWGSYGISAGQFISPTSVAVAPDGTVYVADMGNHRIQYFTPTGQFLGRWGTQGSGDGQFQSPAGVAVAPDGTVYVADTGNHRIQYFTRTGQFLGKWGTQGDDNGRFQSPAGVAVTVVERQISTDTTVLTDTVYVADTGNQRIQYFSKTGEFVGKWGSRSINDGRENKGKFHNPTDVAVTPAGKVYVADMSNHRIQYFAPTGQFVEKWGSQGGGEGQFQSPAGVAAAPDGLVYVADTGNNRIQYFRASGKYVKFENWLKWPDGADERFLKPADVAISDNLLYAYYPETEQEQILLDYILDLAGCDALPPARAQRTEPITCTNASAFEVPIQPVRHLSETLILDRGKYGGFYTAEALGRFSDVLRVPTSLYLQFYDPCNPSRQIQERCDPGLWRVAAGPATVALMATFYDLPAAWNPYGPGADPAVRIPLRNRIVLNALVDLLSSMEKLVSTGHQPQWIYNPGFRLNYSAYICQKVCPHLLDQEVARAWYETLMRGLNFLFADSRGYSENGPSPQHDQTTTSETDMAILGLQFANHMLPLARRYGTAADVEHIRQVRDEWTRLLVDMKSRSDAQFDDRYKEGEAKGFLTSGICLLDSTIVASYQGECENFTGELYAAAVADGDLGYAGRINDTLRQAAQLSYDLSLVDYRFPGLNGYTSEQSMSGRADKPVPFPGRSLDIQHYLTGRVAPEYARFLWPQVWHDLIPHLPNDATSFDELVQGAFDTLGRMMQAHLANASDTTTGVRHYPNAMDLGSRPPQYPQTTWGNWLRANAVEHMVNPPRAEIIQGDPSLVLYPVQKTTRRFLTRALGDPGEEDFFVVDQRDPLTGFGYYATLYTGVSFKQTGLTNKGAGGSGMGAFAVAVPPPEDAIMPGRRVAVPIKGEYIGRFDRTGADGKCVKPGRPYNATIDATPQNKPQCAYLFRAGRYDWREWPANAVWAVQPDQMVSSQTVTENVYSNLYYNTVAARMTTSPLSTTAVLTTMTPLSRTFGYLSSASWQDAFGCQDGGQGGCVHRSYTFYPDRMLVETRVTGVDQDDYLRSTLVLEAIPVHFIFHSIPITSHLAPQPEDLEATFGQTVHFWNLDGEELKLTDAGDDGRLEGVARILIYQGVEDLFWARATSSAPGDPQEKLAGVEIRFTSPSTTTVWVNTLPVLPDHRGVMGGDQVRWHFVRNLLVEIPRPQGVVTNDVALSYELAPYREDQACRDLWGDVDCSCRVDVADLQAVASRWRQAAEPPYDLNWDGKVDIRDIIQVVTRWGGRCLRRGF